MQNNEMFLTEDEIDHENLSHYQSVQLQLHGNILRETRRPYSLAESDNIRSTQEEAYIFNLENHEL